MQTILSPLPSSVDNNIIYLSKKKFITWVTLMFQKIFFKVNSFDREHLFAYKAMFL